MELGPVKPPIQWEPTALCLEVKAADQGADCSLLSKSKFKNVGSCMLSQCCTYGTRITFIHSTKTINIIRTTEYVLILSHKGNETEVT
jgi:hypothetical protein